MPHKEKRLKDAKAAAEEADFRVLQTHNGGASRYRGLRFAPPPAKSHSLRSGVRPFRSCCGVIFTTDFYGNWARIFTILCLSVLCFVLICGYFGVVAVVGWGGFLRLGGDFGGFSHL